MDAGREAHPSDWREWLPLGVWMACALALLRGACISELMRLRAPIQGEAEAAIQRFELAAVFPGVLPGAVVIGLLAAAVARAAVNRPQASPRSTLWIGGFVFLAMNTFVAGWFGEPRWSQARYDSGRLFAHQGVQSALVFFLTAFLFHLSRGLAAPSLARRLLRGIGALAGACLLGLVLPLYLLWVREGEAPRYTVRTTAHEFLADPATWKVVESPPGRGPALAILSPAVAQETDSGDKPSLLLPPGTSVELVVPRDVGPTVLRAAAGVDKSVRGTMPEGLDEVTIRFELTLDGRSVFAEEIRSERLQPGVYDPSGWVWRHVGGEAGLALQGGETLRFSTRWVGAAPTLALPEGYPKVGFGGMWLERAVERERTRSSPEEPNVILIVQDTQRADRMSCYGYERKTTPNLDALARRGILYERAYSTASWTWPSTASILTGLDPDVHGVLSQEQCTLQRCFDTLAEALAARGYTTHGVSCNPLIAPERYFDQGFESFVPPPKQRFAKSDEVLPEVLRWVRAHAGVRFFLYLHLVDPHTPHAPEPQQLARLELVAPPDFPERGLDHYNDLLHRAGRRGVTDEIVPPEHRRWISDLYDASVASGDRWIGTLLDLLGELDLEGRTLVAFTADHGEELLDHGMLEHTHSLYDELVHVPLLLAGPGIRAGERVGEVVSLRQLAPTLARLGGASLPRAAEAGDLLTGAGAGFAQFQTSKGLWPSPKASPSAGWLKRQRLSGLRRGDLSLFWREGGELPPPEEDLMLFDGSVDPRQLEDLASKRPGERQKLYDELSHRLEQQRKAAPAFPVGGSDSVNAMLQQVGYAQGEEPQDD